MTIPMSGYAVGMLAAGTHAACVLQPVNCHWPGCALFGALCYHTIKTMPHECIECCCYPHHVVHHRHARSEELHSPAKKAAIHISHAELLAATHGHAAWLAADKEA
jgi:hypothetical protein